MNVFPSEGYRGREVGLLSENFSLQEFPCRIKMIKTLTPPQPRAVAHFPLLLFSEQKFALSFG